MFCVHCGKEIEENATFCSYCGEKQATGSSAPEQSEVATLFHSVFGSNNFHLATVFFLVCACASAVASLAVGTMPLPIIEIFIIISLFKLQKLARDKAPAFAFASPLKTFRIIISIYRVVLWVLVGIFAVCGIILAFAGGVAGLGLAEVLEEILNEADFSLYGSPLSVIGGIAVSFAGILFIVISVVCALLNVFMYGSFYKSAKSAEWTAGTGNYQFEKLDSTYNWLVFLVVMQGISTLSLIASIFTGGIFNLVATGFNIAFIILILKCIKEIKNSRQIEIL